MNISSELLIARWLITAVKQCQIVLTGELLFLPTLRLQGQPSTKQQPLVSIANIIQNMLFTLCEVTLSVLLRTTLPVLQVHPKGNVGNNDPSVHYWQRANF